MPSQISQRARFVPAKYARLPSTACSAHQVVAALSRLCVPELTALTLPDRVPTDDHISALNQPLAERLIMNFPIGGVAARHKNGGVRFIRVLRHVDKRRDIDTGKAFENQLLDSKAVHLDLAGDPWMQRCSFAGQAAQHGEQMLFQFLL